MTGYFGTTASETLNSSNWNYSWTHFYMNDGNDTVVTPSTGVGYYFNGGGGNDYFLGDTNSDYVYGGTGNDTLDGYSGNDTLSGQDGIDKLYGGLGNDNLAGEAGDDRIDGGAGTDYLSGGYYGGVDKFVFRQGESNAINGQADTIGDWDVSYDYIDSTLAGTSSSYSEAATSYTNIGDARWQVEHNSTLRSGDHAFLYNSATDTGYLLSDLDGNYTFETGVVIRGAGAASDMSHSDII